MWRLLGALLILGVGGCRVPQPAVLASEPEEPVHAAELAYAAPAEDRAAPLRDILHEIVAAQQYATPPVPIAPAGPPPASAADLEAVRTEVAGLRQEIADLRSELNEYLGQVVEGLEAENRRLRDELASREPSAGEAGAGVPVAGGGEVPAEVNPAVPAPGADKPAETVAEGPAEPPIELPEPETPPRPFVFTSVKEWGRTPEQAAKQPGGASSLFGMVGTVPRGSREEDLLGLARDLRARYGQYDNINVEIFDDPTAAQAYADRQELDRARRVLTVSKHAASKRDVTLLYRKGAPIDVTQPGAPPAKPE